MQANLKETGMSGTMYRREDLAGMMDKMKDMVSAHAARPPRNSQRAARRNSLSSALSPLQFPEGDPEMGMDGEEVVGEGGVATEAPDAGEIDYADDEKDEV